MVDLFLQVLTVKAKIINVKPSRDISRVHITIQALISAVNKRIIASEKKVLLKEKKKKTERFSPVFRTKALSFSDGTLALASVVLS